MGSGQMSGLSFWHSSARWGKILVLIGIISTPAFAALSPSPSRICAALLIGQKALGAQTHGLKRRSLNSIEVLRQHLEGAQESQFQPEIHSGKAWQAPNSVWGRGNLTRKETIEQLVGIQKYAQMSEAEGAEAGEKWVLDAFTLFGEAEIIPFLQALNTEAMSRTQEELGAEILVRFFPVAMTLAGIGLLTFGPDDFFTRFSGYALSSYWIKLDSSLHRNWTARRDFQKMLSTMQELSAPNGRGGWAMYSVNAKLTEPLLQAIDQSAPKELIKYHLVDQVFEDSESNSRIHFGFSEANFKWVGVDLILDHRGESPELHVVIRRSEKRPILPKVKKLKREDSSQAGSLSPEFQPGYVPIRN